MRGLFRRPFLAVLNGLFLTLGGVAMACWSVFYMEPRHVLAGAILMLVGLSCAGVWPGDRDLDDADSAKWKRMGAAATWLPLGSLMADLFLPIPDGFATALIAAGLLCMLACTAWFLRHGVPLENHHIEAEMAKPGHNPLLTFVSASPGRWGKAARIVTAAFGGVIAVLMLGATAIITTAAMRQEAPPLGAARWQSLPVVYCIDAFQPGYVEDEALAASVERAFERWGVPAESDGACAQTMRLGDGVSSIGWRPRAQDETWIGKTWIIRSCEFFCDVHERRAIAESDIRLEPLPAMRFRTEACLDDLILHEVGHFLGLRHSDEGVIRQGGVCSGTEFTSADLAPLFERYGDEIQPDYDSATTRD